MRNLKRIIGIIVGFIIFIILGVMISIPLVNDYIAKKTAKDIEKIELPVHTEYMETFWKAGKLVGNGNGTLFLDTMVSGNNYYIVYSWGSNDLIFSEFDLRGH